MDPASVTYSSYQSEIQQDANDAEVKTENIRCKICQQIHCDVRIVGCGCLIHTTCIPLNLLAKQQNGMTFISCQNIGCPSCGKLPLYQIVVLPLPIPALEQASRLREENNNFVQNESPCSSTGGAPAGSIALVNGSCKRGSTSRSCDKSFRTGRWASEESTYVDKLIQCFDAGLLALPHGIKLNDFLCEMLSCRTSRLTKKLKNAKLSTRSYRSLISGGYLNDPKGINLNLVASIQRAQTLFLKTVTPEWVRIELQFNISRMWRTHLANFCLQIGFASLDTKQWFVSLDAVDFLSQSSGETEIQARRKRMKSALSDDVSIAATYSQPNNPYSSAARVGNSSQGGVNTNDKSGVFMGGLPVKKLSELNLKKLMDESFANDESSNQFNQNRSSFSELIQTEETLKHSSSLSSFADLFSPEFNPRASRAPSRSGSFSLDNPTQSRSVAERGSGAAAHFEGHQGVSRKSESLLDNAIDSIIESSSSDQVYHGRFLQDVAKYLMNLKAPFQHVDLWVPLDMDQSDTIHVGNLQKITNTSSDKMSNVVYCGQQNSSLRLTHAGYISIPSSAPSHILQRLDEFGMYSKHFSFLPGFGAPGRVYLSGQPSWETNVGQASPSQFARVGGARTYGVNTCLAIPVPTHIGNMIVMLYSTASLAVDAMFEKTCMDFFRKLRPEPRWKLTIDVGIQIDLEKSREREALLVAQSYNPVCASPNSFIPSSQKASYIPPSPTPSSVGSAEMFNATSNISSLTWSEQSLALLLGKYMPLGNRPGLTPNPSDNGIMENPDVAEHLISLRLLLLRHSSCRSELETNLAQVIMERFKFLSPTIQKESDLVLQLVNEWKNLVNTSSIAGAAHLKSPNPRNSYSSEHSELSSFPCQARVSGAMQQISFQLPGDVMESMGNLPPDFPHDLSFLKENSFVNGTNDGNSNFIPQPGSDSSNFARVVSEQGPMGERQFKQEGP